jgi:hypothetical protein
MVMRTSGGEERSASATTYWPAIVQASNAVGVAACERVRGGGGANDGGACGWAAAQHMGNHILACQHTCTQCRCYRLNDNEAKERVHTANVMHTCEQKEHSCNHILACHNAGASNAAAMVAR